MNRLGILAFFLTVAFAHGDSIVATEKGLIQGTTVSAGKVEAYLGIPYAEPPVGALRFAKPVPRKSWSDIYNATQLPPPCIQLDLRQLDLDHLDYGLDSMTEDCLYLNVWVPQSNDTENLKAIMVFIHGGAFMTGTTRLRVYNGATLAGHGDVIVVTFNYRVGALGFFAGGTEDAPGNQALHDQILALKWVKDNARHFGGDPDNIAIFGESAGAFSVSLLQISPSSRDLFKRAILQSGSAVNPQYSVENEMVTTINSMYAREMGCADENTVENQEPSEILDCMRNAPPNAFAEADMKLFSGGISILIPRFGEELFPNSAVNMFQEGHFKDSEVMMGITRDEGMVGIFLINPGLLQLINSSEWDLFNRTTAYEAIAKNSLSRQMLSLTTPEEAERIVQSYLEAVNEETGYSYLRAFSDAFGDILITCGNYFQAEYQSESPVYFYMFDHRTEHSPFPEWMGVAHFEEVPYVFGNSLFGPFTEEEEELSRKVMDIWTSFAKTGQPNVTGGLEWPRFTAEDPNYYIIDIEDRIATRPDHHRCERWRNIFLGSDR